MTEDSKLTFDLDLHDVWIAAYPDRLQDSISAAYTTWSEGSHPSYMRVEITVDEAIAGLAECRRAHISEIGEGEDMRTCSGRTGSAIYYTFGLLAEALNGWWREDVTD